MVSNQNSDVNDILNFLEAGEKLGVTLPPHLREKLDKLSVAGAGKLKVALVGGFSEGKTSLAAAWLGMVPSDMKISQSESSNAVTVYDASDEVELIDTPGLFGFKEKNIGDGIAEKYKELSRKYVSEANLVLYVLNPSNPLKDSHRDELNWLFRELALLSRTVFVIGPDKKIKLMLIYPMSTGRNFDEIIHVLDSIQLTTKHKVSTPANWKNGDNVILAGTVSDEEGQKLYPDSFKKINSYIRTVAQPK